MIHQTKEQEYKTIHQVRFKKVLATIDKLNLKKSARILDIGCYPLFLFNALKKKEFNLFGISSSHEPVTTDTIITLNIEKNKLPYPDNHFDLILASEVIEHLTANPAVYLQEIRRVLKPQGYFLITTPNAAHLKNRMKLLLGKSPSFSIAQLEQTKVNDDSIYFRHNREFTMKELREIIHQATFTIRHSSFESFYTPFRKGKKTSLVQIVGYGITILIPPFRDSLLIIAEK